MAAEEILGNHIARGVVLDVKKCPEVKYLQTFCGTHPLPSDENLAATEAIVAALERPYRARSRHIRYFGWWFNASLSAAEPERPRRNFHFQRAYRCGRDDRRIEHSTEASVACARWLACEYAYPARVISLIFSDVPGDDISFVASGPTVKDQTTIEEAEDILAKFNVLRTCGIEKCDLVITPKDEKYFARVKNILVVSNRKALEAMQSDGAKARFYGGDSRHKACGRSGRRRGNGGGRDSTRRRQNRYFYGAAKQRWR